MSRPAEGIATDGAHSIKNSLTRYRGVDLRSGEQLFLAELGNRTANIGEFLGVVHAARYIIEHGYQPEIIYTDSITAIAWFNNKRTASKKRCAELQRAEVFLKAMSSRVDQIRIIHWDNEGWGETPADFNEK